ncbi:MAG: SDR family oxidoreductase [Candidatus Pelethousia sp.]|nr:SDR family oxidoreductase [Candidatus Pelethousia sp.]
MNEMFSIAGKTVVIAGSAGTVGMRLCNYLSELGAGVAAIDMNPTGALTEKENAASRFYQCDITDQVALEKTAVKIQDDFGHIDVLINLVCTFGAGVKAMELPYERWKTDMKINVDTYFLTSTVFGRYMMDQGGGSIINFASTASFSYIRGSYKTSYCVSKAAVASLTRSLAYEFAENKIRVNAIAPGFIDIRENINSDSGSICTERERDRIDRVPLHKLAQIKDLLGPIVMFASDASSFVTGQVLLVDGGFLLYN